MPLPPSAPWSSVISFSRIKLWKELIWIKLHSRWGLCTLRHGIQNAMEAILACHPALSTEWLDWVAKWCELQRTRICPVDIFYCIYAYHCTQVVEHLCITSSVYSEWFAFIRAKSRLPLPWQESLPSSSKSSLLQSVCENFPFHRHSLCVNTMPLSFNLPHLSSKVTSMSSKRYTSEQNDQSCVSIKLLDSSHT